MPHKFLTRPVSFFKPLLVVVGLMSCYALIYVSFHKLTGVKVTALTSVAVALAGWLLGLRWGLFAGLLAAAVNGLLEHSLLGRSAWFLVTMKWPTFVVGIALGTAAGWVSELVDRVQTQASELLSQKEKLKHELCERQRLEQALRTSEGRFQAFMDHSPAITFLQDAQGRYLLVNRTARQVFKEQDWIGKSNFEVFPSAVAESVRRHDTEVFEQNKPIERITWIPDHADVNRAWWVIKFPVQDASGQRYVGGIALDITKRLETEEALLKSEEFSRRMIESSADGINLLDLQGHLAWTSEHRHHLLGLSAIDVLQGHDWLGFWADGDRDAARRALNSALAGGTSRFQGRWRSLGSEAKWWEVVVTPIRNREGSVEQILAVFHDISDRKQVEQALHASDQRLQGYVQERKRLSRDLHDGIIQAVYVAGMSLEECQEAIHENPLEVQQRLGAAISALNEVIRDLRSHVLRLEPPRCLTGEDLEAELHALVRSMSTGHFKFELHLDPTAARSLNGETSYQALRIAREAMSNSIRHSAAHSGFVSLQFHDDSVRLEIGDEGIGFDVHGSMERGQGLRNMVARGEALGTKIHIMSQPGEGTRLVLDLPRNDL